MSKSINQICLSGELDRDADLRSTPTGTSVCACMISCVEEFTKKDAPSKFFTNRFELKAFSRTADEMAAGRKGDRVVVSGSLGTESWKGQYGKNNYKVVVKVERIVFLDPAQDDDQGQPSAPSQPAPPGRQPTAREMANKAVQDDPDSSDVPF